MTNFRGLRRWGVRAMVAPLFFLATPGLISPGLAHQIKSDGDVGGTIHIEPNEPPHTGVPSQVWLGLARRGGELISPDRCHCTLSVYASPVEPGEAPLQQATLDGSTIQNFEAAFDRDMTFPDVGIYELVVQGQPKTAGEFEPFELRFNVTVATIGRASPTSSASPNANESAAPISSIPVQQSPAPISQRNQGFWLAGVVIVCVAGAIVFLIKRPKKSG